MKNKIMLMDKNTGELLCWEESEKLLKEFLKLHPETMRIELEEVEKDKEDDSLGILGMMRKAANREKIERCMAIRVEEIKVILGDETSKKLGGDKIKELAYVGGQIDLPFKEN